MTLLVRFLASFIFCYFSASAAWAQKMEGVFMVVKGDIKVVSKDGSQSGAKVGKKVSQGDTIVSGPDSRAKVVMTDKNVLNISPDSKIMIEKYENDGKDNKNVELNVLYGKVRASVEQKYDGEKSKFNVKTPSAVAGVRGTDFITGYSSQTKQTSITTFAGSVAVGQPGPGGTILNPVFVQKGQTTNASPSGVEPPKPVPAEDLKQMNQESSAETAGSQSTNEQATASSEEKQDEKKDEKKEEVKEESAKNSDEPKKEEGKKEEAKADEPKKEDTKEAKKEDVKKDEPKKEEAKKDEPKKETVAAKDEPKKDEPKKETVAAKDEPKKNDAKNEPKKDGPKSDSPSGDRAPASAGGPPPPGGMVKREDLPSVSGTANIIPKGPQAPSLPTVPVRVPASPVSSIPKAPTNNFVNEAVKNSKSKAIIIIKPGS